MSELAGSVYDLKKNKMLISTSNLLKGLLAGTPSYGKKPQQRQAQTQIVLSWKAEVDLLIELLDK